MMRSGPPKFLCPFFRQRAPVAIKKGAFQGQQRVDRDPTAESKLDPPPSIQGAETSQVVGRLNPHLAKPANRDWAEVAQV